MRTLLFLFVTLSLTSCAEVELDDLNAFVVKTKAQIYPVNDKVPALKKIDTLVFDKKEGRNPFSEPKAEVTAPVKNAPKSCPQPDFKRKKQALEMYSLENLVMRGTLLSDDLLWGLVQVADGELYKVKKGYYLGLNHGKVLNVSKNKIELLELFSDREGCWQERITQITLQTQY